MQKKKGALNETYINLEMREKAKGSIRLRMVDFWCQMWNLQLMLCLTGLLQWGKTELNHKYKP